MTFYHVLQIQPTDLLDDRVCPDLQRLSFRLPRPTARPATARSPPRLPDAVLHLLRGRFVWPEPHLNTPKTTEGKHPGS